MGIRVLPVDVGIVPAADGFKVGLKEGHFPLCSDNSQGWGPVFAPFIADGFHSRFKSCITRYFSIGHASSPIVLQSPKTSDLLRQLPDTLHVLRDADVLRALGETGLATDAGIGSDLLILGLILLQERFTLVCHAPALGISGQERVALRVEDLEVAGDVHAEGAGHAVGAGRAGDLALGFDQVRDVQHEIMLLLVEGLEAGEQGDIFFELFHVGHAAQGHHHAGQRAHARESVRCGGEIGMALLQHGADAVADVRKLSALDRLHHQGRDALALQVFVQVLGARRAGGAAPAAGHFLPVDIIELDLHEIPVVEVHQGRRSRCAGFGPWPSAP